MDVAAAGGPTAAGRIVGIGASAGGLEALEQFFDNLPSDTGMAFVVIQHLSPDFKSIMDELLARHTQLPVKLVEDGMPVESNHVYLIPPKKEMIISGGRLLLSEQDRQQDLSLPIDVFFRSLAQDCGPRAIAVVLTGGGSDGSRGVIDVREAGGLVVVQEPATAQFDSMPRAALDAGVAHVVLPPREMPRAIVEHAKRAQTDEAPIEVTVQAAGLGLVYRMLQEEFGIDFTHYKPSTVTRRIERRLALARSPDIDEYVRRLKGERKELDALYRDLLIGVTRFFRDEEAFKVLEEQVLPELLRREPRSVPLRIWVAGCATGEEAYSLAILLQDLMARSGERAVKIFATDVHRGSLDQAARAVYDEEAVAGVSADRLARYFLRTGDSYQVVPELRQMIVFAQHNVIRDAPFTRVDLVACRNLLIYLQPPAQQKVLSLFHFALNRGGVLFLGPSETAGALSRGFESVDKHWRLYRKQSDTRMAVMTSATPPSDSRWSSPPAAGPSTRVQPPAIRSPNARQSLAQLLGTYDALLAEVMPPSFLVSERGELIQSFGGASQFLRLRDGRQGLDVIDLVDDDLKMVLVGGLKRALSGPGVIVYRNVHIPGPAAERERDGEPRACNVSLRRIVAPSGAAGASVLVSFEAIAPRADNEAARRQMEVAVDELSRDQLRSLEAELRHTKESLQSAIEELESSNEELQASNEELQTSNEELQSTNEELQSVNEELYTVNAEYQRKIGELIELTNDMDNLLSSTEIGTIFLDNDLRIRKFTPRIAETFALVPHDVGRPIETFAHKMQHPEMVDDFRRVLASGEPVERELRDLRGRAYFMRILPYRAKGIIDGVVLTLIDVSGLKAAEDALFHERYLLNSLLASVPDAIYFKDARGRFIRLNQPMATRLGLRDPGEATGKTAFELSDRDLATALDGQDEEVLRTGAPQLYRLERRSRAGGTGTPEWALVTRVPLRDRGEAIVGVVGIFRDISKQKLAEEEIQRAVQRRDQFLAMLSHELRNPLGAIVTATSLLKLDSEHSARGDKFLNILERQSEQMARLLDDLLEASRVTQNKIDLRKRVVDVSAIAREAADAVRGMMEARGVALVSDIAADPVYVDGDPARLQQIQINLLNNAAKYTPRGGRVELRTACEDGQAVIRVRDDGAGIPREMLETIFDLFVQSARTLDRAAGGLGLGLTVVKSLVAMHGGTVSAHSDGEGKGSEFVVRLPLAEGPAVISAPRPRPRHLLPDGEKPRLVVVEDSADSRELLCDLLRHAGFECHTADNGASALRLIEEVAPQIAVLDLGIPEIDGLEVARRLRADPRHANMFLIALTGYGQNADRAAAREAGFDEHLVKPVDPLDLVSLLNSLRSDGRRRSGTQDAAAGLDGAATGSSHDTAV